MAVAGTIEAPLKGGVLGFARAVSVQSRIAVGIGLLSIVSGTLTYAAITGLTPYNATPSRLVWLFLIDFALVTSLAALIAWRMVRLWV